MYISSDKLFLTLCFITFSISALVTKPITSVFDTSYTSTFCLSFIILLTLLGIVFLFLSDTSWYTKLTNYSYYRLNNLFKLYKHDVVKNNKKYQRFVDDYISSNSIISYRINSNGNHDIEQYNVKNMVFMQIVNLLNNREDLIQKHFAKHTFTLLDFELLIKDFNTTEPEYTETDNINQLECLNKLDNLEQLKNLEKLSELKQLNDLTKLENLTELKQLERLTKLENLAELKQLDGLTELNNLKHLNNLEELTQLKQLKDLKKLENLKCLDNLEQLNKLDALSESENPNKINVSNILSKQEYLNDVGKVEIELEVKNFVLNCYSKGGVKSLGDRCFGYFLRHRDPSCFTFKQCLNAWGTYIGEFKPRDNCKYVRDPATYKTSSNVNATLESLYKIRNFYSTITQNDSPIIQNIKDDINNLLDLASVSKTIHESFS